tara:strand:+ start:409 stop:564 length:156 start_codon:yes stop_codon:yes gene_type:complete
MLELLLSNNYRRFEIIQFELLEQIQKLPAAFSRSKHSVFRTFGVQATAETI